MSISDSRHIPSQDLLSAVYAAPLALHHDLVLVPLLLAVPMRLKVDVALQTSCSGLVRLVVPQHGGLEETSHLEGLGHERVGFWKIDIRGVAGPDGDTVAGISMGQGVSSRDIKRRDRVQVRRPVWKT